MFSLYFLSEIDRIENGRKKTRMNFVYGSSWKQKAKKKKKSILQQYENILIK